MIGIASVVQKCFKKKRCNSAASNWSVLLPNITTKDESFLHKMFDSGIFLGKKIVISLGLNCIFVNFTPVKLCSNKTLQVDFLKCSHPFNANGYKTG